MIKKITLLYNDTDCKNCFRFLYKFLLDFGFILESGKNNEIYSEEVWVLSKWKSMRSFL